MLCIRVINAATRRSRARFRLELPLLDRPGLTPEPMSSFEQRRLLNLETREGLRLDNQIGFYNNWKKREIQHRTRQDHNGGPLVICSKLLNIKLRPTQILSIPNQTNHKSPMSGTADFIKSDFLGTLFPMKTNLIVLDKYEKELSEYIATRVLSDAHPADNFLPQQRVHATKPRGHLRRTVKLDPVAEYFLYDIVYRNRAAFRPQVGPLRRSFGYRFIDGVQIPVHAAYKEYQNSLSELATTHSHRLQFDIASYFNTLYHHDIGHWFAARPGTTEEDATAIGKFFREINAGRSVDFLPHGIYPAKMIGNEFLKLVDLSGTLKSSSISRFMDDFNLFDNDQAILRQDFFRVQQLLGQFGLNVNPSKTIFDNTTDNVESTLSKIHKSLTKIVEGVAIIEGASGIDFVQTEEEVTTDLTTDQITSLLSLLRDESLEEADADLILGFLRSHSDDILEHLPTLLRRFPNLIKHIYSICGSIADKSSLIQILLDYLNGEPYFIEYQLFWLACLVEDHLLGEGCYGDVLLKLYELSQEFPIARAKVLEIPEQGFGLKEIRSTYLKTGQSDWTSWASATGTRTLMKAERNYALDYFSKGSPLNFIIAESVKRF